ncbi:MAG: extracellular solute-binding protein [Rhizobiaceae bacterium]
MDKLSRRRFIQLAAGTAGMAAVGSDFARAQGQLTIGGYGGDVQKYLSELVFKYSLEPKGISPVLEAALDDQRKLKLLAERKLPRGTYDVVYLHGPNLNEMNEQGVFDQIETSRIPLYQELPADLQKSYAIPHIATYRVIVYNPQHVSDVPTTMEDLWNSKYANRIGLVDGNYGLAISCAALINGGNMTDYEPGKEKLLELKKLGARVYPSNEAFAQALQTGECWVGVSIQSRGIMWKQAGVPIDIAYPREGVVREWWGFAIPKNARNKDDAYEFINATLADHAQMGWAEKMFAHAQRKGLTQRLDPAIAKRFEMPADAKIIAVDEKYWTENSRQLKDWWDRVFKA